MTCDVTRSRRRPQITVRLCPRAELVRGAVVWAGLGGLVPTTVLHPQCRLSRR